MRSAISKVLDKQSYSSGETGLAAQRAALVDLEAREQRIQRALEGWYSAQERGATRRGITVWRGVPT